MIAPAYPPTARGSGTVLLEVEIDADGSVRQVRVVSSGGSFDPAAIQAAERWSFSPARDPAGALPSLAYVVMGFAEPVGPAIRR
jgi:TonB family protein